MEEKIKQTKTQLFWEIFRFLLVGGTATVLDYIVFYLFRQWILPGALVVSDTWDIISLTIATALGFVVGLIVNWVLPVKFVLNTQVRFISLSLSAAQTGFAILNSFIVLTS